MIVVPRGVAKVLDIITATGAINWGLIALFQFNVVFWLTSLIGILVLERILYIIIGLCGVYTLLKALGFCKCV